MIGDITGLASLDLEIMDSAMRADTLIRQMKEAAAEGYEDVDYSCEGLLPEDEDRVDEVYRQFFQR